LAKVPSLPDVSAAVPEAFPLKATGTDCTTPAPLLHQTSGLLGQSSASHRHKDAGGKSDGVNGNDSAGLLQVAAKSAVGIKRNDPAPSGTGSDKKRAMRFELTTFTLAT
jgi:hypothetical protein